MSYLSKYLNQLSAPLSAAVEQTSNSVFDRIQNTFDYRTHITGLLLGNVQSGKTAQMLGVVSKLADNSFEIFIILSSDNVHLYKQTKERIESSLEDFHIYGETEDVNFLSDRLSRPIAIVLKKNTNVLKKWRNLLSSSGYCSGRPLVIIDDEADAASLNTLVNKNRVSTINKHLSSIKDLSTSSLYIQVTATPQAIILQSNLSGWKPAFIEYFNPGTGYIGGDFIYSYPQPFCIKLTAENELDSVKLQDYIPDGLRQALLSYLIVCGHTILLGNDTCNFLVHPSVKVNDHNSFSIALGEHLNSLLAAISDESDITLLKEELRKQWNDLKISKPELEDFDDLLIPIKDLIENQNLKVLVLNSTSSRDINYQTGFNIIVGGNSLGRGVTFPHLQTVYYCRKSKTPQADTFWQHARMFGYDRDRALLRVFLPASLYNLFSELNISNKLLINQIISNAIDKIQLIYPENIRPTRTNVLDKKALNLIVGGVNFFSSDPIQNNAKIVDELTIDFDSAEKYHIVPAETLIALLNYVGDIDNSDWDRNKFVDSIKTLSLKRPTTKYALIIRKDRDISKGTGTLLSPTDRNIGEKLEDWVVLTLYRVKGDTSKGWHGIPFYIPNIKLPGGICIYDTIDI